jgi:glycosyltransferase involved in cell wall biosynthesis
MGLANGLSHLADGDETYLFLTYAGCDDWLRPHLRDRCRAVSIALPKPNPILRSFVRSAIFLRLFARIGHFILPAYERPAVSDGTIEIHGAHLMHFTFQTAFKTCLPSIYQPWDLQHLHHPEFFPKWQRIRRDRRYRQYCREARLVVVAFKWMKHQLVRHYHLPEEKIAVIPMAAPIDAYPELTPGMPEAIRRKHHLPESFMLYPAQTYPHKNHLKLLEALSLLRHRHGLRPTLICTGLKTDFYKILQRRCEILNLGDQVKFLGYVPPLDLKCIFSLARFLVFPTLYEGWGLPVTEALRLGVPIVCSDLEVLREQAHEAALYFDPKDSISIADAIHQLWTTASLRRDLRKAAETASALYDWDRTARMFRAQYRRLCGARLSDEDMAILGGSY